MPWKETSPMNERVKFVAAILQAEESFSEICGRFGISRKQGYKWKQRYEVGGVEALVDRSRAPQSHPHAVSSEVEGLLVAARKKHPLWGPRKLLVPSDCGRYAPRSGNDRRVAWRLRRARARRLARFSRSQEVEITPLSGSVSERRTGSTSERRHH
jgi:transposase-like protein